MKENRKNEGRIRIARNHRGFWHESGLDDLRRFLAQRSDETVVSSEVRCTTAARLTPQQELNQCAEEYLALKAKEITPGRTLLAIRVGHKAARR